MELQKNEKNLQKSIKF